MKEQPLYGEYDVTGAAVIPPGYEPQIKNDQFELYKACIKTGQIEQSEVPKLFEENPEFAAWYRANNRQ